MNRQEQDAIVIDTLSMVTKKMEDEGRDNITLSELYKVIQTFRRGK